MTAKVRDMEENTRERIIRSMMKELVECDQDVVGNESFIVQLEDRQKREMDYFLLTHVSSEEVVGHEVNEPISNLRKNNMDC